MSLPPSPPIDRTYRKPKLKLPPGACDTHFHFIGPQKQFPLKPNHVFSHLEFEDTPIEDWLKMQDALGLSRGLHVQSMMYENNYEIVLHGQCRFPDRLRAVCIPWSGITDGELEILTKSGVVGYRVTNRLEKPIDTRMIKRIHKQGWAIHYLVRSRRRLTNGVSRSSPRPADSCSSTRAASSPTRGSTAGYKFVLPCLDTGPCWLKLSPREQSRTTSRSTTSCPRCDLVKRYPDRLLWGSDWPHPQYFKPMPNDIDLLDQMLDWVPEEATRNKIFVDNPAELFAFPPAAK